MLPGHILRDVQNRKIALVMEFLNESQQTDSARQCAVLPYLNDRRITLQANNKKKVTWFDGEDKNVYELSFADVDDKKQATKWVFNKFDLKGLKTVIPMTIGTEEPQSKEQAIAATENKELEDAGIKLADY